jgi:hypothetical protein
MSPLESISFAYGEFLSKEFTNCDPEIIKARPFQRFFLIRNGLAFTVSVVPFVKLAS